MGNVIRFDCPHCRYSSGDLSIGYGGKAIYVCRNCKIFANPAPIPFRFDSPPCPACNGKLKWADRLKESGSVSCPRCQSAGLEPTWLLHFQPAAVLFPDQGQIVHGFLQTGGAVELVDYRWLEEADLLRIAEQSKRIGITPIEDRKAPAPNPMLNGVLTDDPPDLPLGTAIECEVIDAKRFWIRLMFIRTVQPDDF